jgi:hypothetical protein
MKNFFQKPFLLIFLLTILAELLSFFGFLLPAADVVIFFILSIFIFTIAFKRLDYAILLLLAELFIGSKGHLFSFDVGSFSISLRMIIYSAVLLSWLWRLKKKKFSVNFARSNFFIPFLLFIVFVLLGLVTALFNHHQLIFIYSDFNAWLYLLLIFPFFDVFKSNENQLNIFRVLLAAMSWLAVKTFLVFFIFSHQIKEIMPDLFYWIRLKGLGEVTILEPVYRVFFQSQIYSMIGFFILLSLIIFLSEKNKKNFIFLSLPLIPVILSFSRSFWLGFLVALLGYFIFLKIKQKFNWKSLISIFISIIAVFVITFGFLWLSLQIPPKAVFNLSNLFDKRLDANEAAAMSRISQLTPLISTILKNPTTGSGFGQTVSYFSQDPRAFERDTLGLYTTYAFEWGYLDIWLKIGFVGLMVFLAFIWQIFKKGWDIVVSYQISVAWQKPLIVGLIFGLFALLITNIFSPYLNHPLGIGYLLICATIINYAEKRT